MFGSGVASLRGVGRRLIQDVDVELGDRQVYKLELHRGSLSAVVIPPPPRGALESLRVETKELRK